MVMGVFLLFCHKNMRGGRFFIVNNESGGGLYRKRLLEGMVHYLGRYGYPLKQYTKSILKSME